MKVVILAGGLGTRLSEETVLKPKPMVEVGQYPILWHIMKIYSYYGFNDFILLCGYKFQQIKRFFADYYLNSSDITIDMQNNAVQVHSSHAEPWKVTILNTGLNTSTGRRIKMAAPYILSESEVVGDKTTYFSVTYGDGVADVNLHALIEYHKSAGKTGTLTAVRPSGRFGAIGLESDGQISSFVEKPDGDGGWVNGGFFIFEKSFLDFIPEKDVMLEQEPLQSLIDCGELNAYRHYGFWKPMDTMRDKNELNALWESGRAPWKLWTD